MKPASEFTHVAMLTRMIFIAFVAACGVPSNLAAPNEKQRPKGTAPAHGATARC
jgi:hypothetical protein